MCFGRPNLPAAQDPAAAALESEREAARVANEQGASNRRLRRQTALASGATSTAGTANTTSVLAQGKTLLGG